MTQPIVLSDSPRHFGSLVLGGVAPLRGLGAELRAIPAIGAAVAELDPTAKTTLGIGIGDRLWRALSPSASPRGLAPFQGVRGRRHAAPATQGDLWIAAESERPDLVFECLMRARRALGRGATVVEEVHGFRYLESRDLTGFVDGTANPPPAERAAVATLDASHGPFAGGSFGFVQRWVHDLEAVRAMPVAEREKMIGRTLADGVELDDAKKPRDAHLARVEISEGGAELEIYRKSFPYGDTSRHGLLFVAMTREPSIIERMLQRMFGAANDGMTDRLLTVSRPVSGGFYFLPSASRLASL
jgi:putative iron-dependent peroxidase